MPLRIEDGIARLDGECGVGEAEPLFAALAAGRATAADLSACRGLHAAAAQALITYDVAILGIPAEGFLRDFVAPALERNRARRRSDHSKLGG